MTGSLNAIFGLAGLEISAEERTFFSENEPFGYILFARNVGTAEQLSALTQSLKDLHDDPFLPIFIDQEGGRVQRLRAPLAPDYPPARVIGDLYQTEPEAAKRAAFLLGRLHAFDLQRYGINANCLPVLDVPVEGAHDVIGHRAYGLDPELVGILGEQSAFGLMAGHVLPVMKHIPGHGRSTADTHKALPCVDTPVSTLSDHDFKPFIFAKNIPAAMTAHIIFSDLDPMQPATLSKTVIDQIIRGKIAFDGLLMSDDVSMHALSGDFDARAKGILAAGCDIVLHCNGEMDEMRAVAQGCDRLTGAALARCDKAKSIISSISQASEQDEKHEAQMRKEFEEITGWCVTL